MAFQLSPGVNVSEIDLTTVVPAVATSDGAIAGMFRWGPVGQRVLIDSENQLVSQFGKPTNFNAETWFTAANFLAYTNRLYVSRAANTTASSVVGSGDISTGNTIILSSNTAGLTANMYLYNSSSTGLPVGESVTIASVNSSAIVLNKPATATATGVDLYFANPATAYSAVAIPDNAVVADLANQIVKNENDYTIKVANSTLNFDSDVRFVAKYPGGLGNSLKVSVCYTNSNFSSAISSSANINFTIGSSTATLVYSGTSNAEAANTSSKLSIGDYILAGNSSIGQQYLKVSNKTVNNNVSGNTHLVVTFEDPYRLHTDYTSNTVNRYWEYFNTVETAPGQSDYVRLNGNTAAQDEMHVVVVDEDGGFTGTPGSILEVYKNLSRASDAKNNDGSTNFYKDVLNINSNYIWFGREETTAASANAMLVASATTTAPTTFGFKYGADGYAEDNVNSFSTIAAAYDVFKSTEDLDVSLILQGRPLGGTTVVDGETISNYQLANYLIDNIADGSSKDPNVVSGRRDCVVFISPDKSKMLNNIGSEAISVKNWRNAVRSSSYAVMDSGYKYMYDRYNDIYRWVPLNGDVAGLCARTDQTNDAWWSPAGLNRGQIKNIVKLAWNPRKAERDVLYSNGVNPVVTFPGQGTILFGDKTLLAKPSAFDRINVRRLFIVLEKAISTAAKYSLFEFNDAFTRAQFKNLVTPYLRNIQGRRGITDFLVVCDDTNNTPQVIDSNQFVGDIYIKPARSINFIQLNFVAVGTGVQFSEVVGKF